MRIAQTARQAARTLKAACRAACEQAFFEGAAPGGRWFSPLLRGGEPRRRGTARRFGPRFALAALFLSGGLWCLMNVRFQPRHSPAPFMPDVWVAASLAGLLVLAAVLCALPRARRYAVFPLLFAVFPAAFLVMALAGGIIKERVPGTAAGNFLEWKFVYDCVWVTLELSLTAGILALCKVSSPFRAPTLPAAPASGMAPPPAPASGTLPPPALPARFFVRAWEWLFIGVVLLLLVLLLGQNQFSPRRFAALLRYQIPFALLMGFKEELFFRWGLMRLGARFFGNAFIAVGAQALIWGVYHGLFGSEHVGAGFWPGFWSWFVACWWGFLACRYRSLGAAWRGHAVIEFYGFYLMYLKYL